VSYSLDDHEQNLLRVGNSIESFIDASLEVAINSEMDAASLDKLANLLTGLKDYTNLSFDSLCDWVERKVNHEFKVKNDLLD
jgi:hypothetical protein